MSEMVLFASVSSAVGVFFEFLRFLKSRKSIFVESHFFLPLYTAGIFQWFVLGARQKDASLWIPCLAQVLILGFMLKTYLKERWD